LPVWILHQDEQVFLIKILYHGEDIYELKSSTVL